MILRLLASVVALAAGPAQPSPGTAVEIALEHGTPPEEQTRRQLEQLLARYDLAAWELTRKIVIDEAAIPHSHPVLTLHARHLRDDLLLLATFIHEQSHWCFEQNHAEAAAAVAELEKLFPGLPDGYPDGAMNHRSTYEHLLVIDFEWRGLKSLVGELSARQVMELWATDHYRAVYRAVLSNEPKVRQVLESHGFHLPVRGAASQDADGGLGSTSRAATEGRLAREGASFDERGSGFAGERELLDDRTPLLGDRTPLLGDRTPLLSHRIALLSHRTPLFSGRIALLSDRTTLFSDRTSALLDGVGKIANLSMPCAGAWFRAKKLRPKQEERMTFAPKKILVCTDFSDMSRLAADAALDLAKLTGGTLTLVHIVPLSAYVGFAAGLGEAESWTADVQASVSASADAALRKEVERLSGRGVKVDFVKADGPPQIEVAAIAARETADLVICGSHGRTGLKHVFVGSVAEGIVRHCKCPVLVFHDGQQGRPA